MRFNLNIIFKLAIILLVGSSIFFTLQVVTFKKDLTGGSKSLTIESGDRVRIHKIIDGDEVAVSRGEKKFVIRILGIRSYDPTINDFQLQNAGQLAYNYLEENILNKEAEARFQNLQLDSKKRLLAYIHISDKDIGADMISRGITLTYRRFPFDRMNQYLDMENKARASRLGFWAMPMILKTSDRLIQLWEKQRRETEK